MKVLYSIQMKTIQVSIPLQNLQLQHKMHHKLKYQQTLILLEFRLELLAQNKIHMTHDHIQIRIHIVISPLIFQLTQMKQYKMKLNITSTHDTSVNVSSPTRTFYNHTRNTTRSRYDPPSIPSAFQQLNKTIQSENNRNNNQQTSSQHYDPFRYSFFPPSNTNIQTNNTQNISQPDNNQRTQQTYAHLLQTNSSQNNFPLQNQRTSYSNNVQYPQRRSQNPPLSHISTDPLYQMNQHTTYNPTTISPPVNMTQPVAPPPQYIPIQQDTFINTSASIPKPMKPFDGLNHSYTPEEYLKQVEARLTFAIGGEPQNNPVKYRSWHNRHMALIQCSLIGTALDWYTILHISYKQQ